MMLVTIHHTVQPPKKKSSTLYGYLLVCFLFRYDRPVVTYVFSVLLTGRERDGQRGVVVSPVLNLPWRLSLRKTTAMTLVRNLPLFFLVLLSVFLFMLVGFCVCVSSYLGLISSSESSDGDDSDPESSNSGDSAFSEDINKMVKGITLISDCLYRDTFI